MAAARCDTCKYYVAETTAVGHCHRYPPVMLSALPARPDVNHPPATFPGAAIPVVQADNWCGEYRAGG